MAQNQENTILKENFNQLTFNDLITSNKDQKSVISIIDALEKMMKVYAKKITYTQMRNIYGVVTAPKDVKSLHIIRPKIAYIQARQDSKEAREFVEFIVDLIKTVEKEEQRKEFLKLMETMVAYHKLYGKNKN